MYLVVEFLEDPKVFSVIPVENVVDGTIRAEIQNFIGKTAPVLWGKRKYDAVLRAQGSKKEMNGICNSLADSAAAGDDESDSTTKITALKKAVNKRTERAAKSRDIASVLTKRKKMSISDEVTLSEANDARNNSPVPNSEVIDASSTDKDNPPRIAPTPDLENHSGDKDVIDKLEIKIMKLKRAKQKLKEKLKEQQKLNESLEQRLKVSTSSSKKVELLIGSGVFLRASKIAAAKLGSKTPTILARKLFRFIFTEEEIKGHSIMGRKCNANKDSAALPPVDPIKRDAIIEFTLSTFNLKQNSTNKGLDEYQYQKGKILSSLGKLIREDNHKTN